LKVEEYRRQRAVEDRHWWYLGHRRLFSSLLESYCPDAPRGRVLDAGCGTGGFTCWLRDRYRPRWLVGVDVSEEALRFCRERGLEELRCCGVEELPFAGDRFDLVVSFNVIYHRAVSDDLAALREMARVLAPEGWLLLNLPALALLRGRHDEAVDGARRYRARQVREMLTASGLEPVKVTYFVFTLLPAIAAFRLASRMDGRPAIRAGRSPSPNPYGLLRPSSDLWMPPPPLNAALTSLLGLEARAASRFCLPLGSSLVALSRKVVR